jgi:uncharacterized protein (TIGR02001 family)
MKQMRLFAAAFVALVAAGTASIPTAQAEDLSYSADIGAVSKYVWRGWAQSSGAAVQGDLNAAYGGLTASLWLSNSYTVTAPGKYNGATAVEADWVLDYSGSYGKVGYDVGGLYYTYLNDSGSNFPEIYAGLSYDAVISPSVKVSYTAADSKSKYYLAGDTWVDLGLSGSAMGVDLSGTISYADWKSSTQYRPVVGGVDAWKSGFNLITLGMSKDFKISDGVTMTPSLTGTIPIAKKASDGNRYIYGVPVLPEVWVGMNFSL